MWAWVKGEYHHAPHGGLHGRTPLDQWTRGGEFVRYPEPALELEDLFLFEAKRRVMKDRTVSLHARLYEVDALLVGQTITLRYDPQAPPSRPIEVVHVARARQDQRLPAEGTEAIAVALAMGELHGAVTEVPHDGAGRAGALEGHEQMNDGVAHLSGGVQHDLPVLVVDEAGGQVLLA